jgi:hypothetical protein
MAFGMMMTKRILSREAALERNFQAKRFIDLECFEAIDECIGRTDFTRLAALRAQLRFDLRLFNKPEDVLERTVLLNLLDAIASAAELMERRNKRFRTRGRLVRKKK